MSAATEDFSVVSRFFMCAPLCEINAIFAGAKSASLPTYWRDSLVCLRNYGYSFGHATAVQVRRLCDQWSGDLSCALSCTFMLAEQVGQRHDVQLAFNTQPSLKALRSHSSNVNPITIFSAPHTGISHISSMKCLICKVLICLTP